jgi:hypothetical protein
VNEVQRALSEIRSIRRQVARGTQFRGYGPMSTAFSGILALVVAYAQSNTVGAQVLQFFPTLAIWIGTAAVCLGLTGLETVLRSKRVHVGIAQQMLQAAVEQFVPALIVGSVLTVVLIQAAPSDIWLLPGLWEAIFSLGIFASCRFLPRPMLGVGVWYLAAGLTSILVASDAKEFLPWTMGIPFGIGQLLVASVLFFCEETWNDV